MHPTLVLYHDAFRLISNNLTDKDRVKDYNFADLESISFAYPAQSKSDKRKKVGMIILTIAVLFIPYFTGDIDFSLSRQIIEIRFNFKNGQLVTLKKAFDSRKKAELFEAKLLRLLAHAKTKTS